MVRLDKYGMPITKSDREASASSSAPLAPLRRRSRSRSPDRRGASRRRDEDESSAPRRRDYDSSSRRRDDRDGDDRRGRRREDEGDRGPTTESSRGRLAQPLPSVPVGMPAPAAAAPAKPGVAPSGSVKMIEVIANDRLGGKVRVKCSPNDTVGDLKKLIAAQKGTKAEKVILKKWYTIYKDHVTLSDYEIHDGMSLEMH